jgi:hypothetical protein
MGCHKSFFEHTYLTDNKSRRRNLVVDLWQETYLNGEEEAVISAKLPDRLFYK